MPTPIRERIVDRLERQLALSTSAIVKRNHRAAVDLSTSVPPWFVNIIDGDHTVDHRDTGLARYSMTVALRLVVGAAEDEGIASALNALYAEVVLAAYQGNRTLGGLAVEVAEQSAELEATDDVGTSAAAAMLLTLGIEFETRDTDPTAQP